MTSVSNSRNIENKGYPHKNLWYPISMGVAFAATMIAASLLPYEYVGLAFTGLLAALLVVDTLAIRRSVPSFWPRLRERGWPLAIAVLVLLFVSVGLIFTVVRPYDQIWLGCVLAGLNLALYIGGWILRERSNSRTKAE